MASGIREGRSARLWRVTSGEQAPEAVNQLLRSLPGWFGIESAIVDYVAKAYELPTYLAWPANGPTVPALEQQPVGVLLAARHFPVSAEIYLMAVEPAMHRQGVGRDLVGALEDDLIADGVELLQVKTLGPSHPDAGYGRTRQFYTSMGFRPLEEVHGLWPDDPCLIMVKTLTQEWLSQRAGDHVNRRKLGPKRGWQFGMGAHGIDQFAGDRVTHVEDLPGPARCALPSLIK